jgi:hypothetical protein
MFREQMISFLQTVIVFLLMTNALSAGVAMYAIWLANGFAAKKEKSNGAVRRKIEAMLGRDSNAARVA